MPVMICSVLFYSVISCTLMSRFFKLSFSVLKVIHSVGQGHGFGGNLFSLVHLDDLGPQLRLSVSLK